MGKKRNIARALGYMNAEMFTEENGAEAWMPRVLVLIVVGKQTERKGDGSKFIGYLEVRDY